MRARYIPETAIETLLDPDSPAWSGSRSEKVQLIGTPIGLQPTDAIRVKWATKKIGATSSVDASAVHDGRVLAFRLTWQDASESHEIDDTGSFADGAAILLPSVAGAPIVTMGAAGLPVNGWYWRADEQGRGRQIVAEGIGTSRTIDLELVRGRGVWKAGGWAVVIARPLRIETAEPIAQLEPGQTVQFGLAVWEGGHSERGGLKAFSVDWRNLEIEAAKAERS